MLQQLLGNIERYLVADCSLQDLETWLLSNLQGILDSGNAAAIEVADEVDADLVELREGLIDETEFRNRLESFIRLRETIQVVFPKTECPVAVRTGADDTTLIEQLTEPKPVEELRLSHVFV